MTTASTIVSTIDAAILSLASGAKSSFEIDGVKYTYQSVEDLRKVRQYYQGIVGTEDAITNGTAPFGVTGIKAGSAK